MGKTTLLATPNVRLRVESETAQKLDQVNSHKELEKSRSVTMTKVIIEMTSSYV